MDIKSTDDLIVRDRFPAGAVLVVLTRLEARETPLGAEPAT